MRKMTHLHNRICPITAITATKSDKGKIMEELQSTVDAWLVIILGGAGLAFLGWMHGWFDKYFKKPDSDQDKK